MSPGGCEILTQHEGRPHVGRPAMRIRRAEIQAGTLIVIRVLGVTVPTEPRGRAGCGDDEPATIPAPPASPGMRSTARVLQEEALVGTRVGKRAEKTNEECAHLTSFGSTHKTSPPLGVICAVAFPFLAPSNVKPGQTDSLLRPADAFRTSSLHARIHESARVTRAVPAASSISSGMERKLGCYREG